MADEIDWRVVTFAGNRRRQREEFRALPLRDKLIVIEQLSMVTEYFLARRRAASDDREGVASTTKRLIDKNAELFRRLS